MTEIGKIYINLNTDTKSQDLDHPKEINTQKFSKELKADLDYGSLPLYFIPNKNQVQKKALFYSRTPCYTLWITQEGLLFDAIKKIKKEDPEYWPQSPEERLKVLTKLSVRKAAKIITGSNYSKNDIIKTYKLSLQKVYVIPYGISPNFQPGLDEGKKEKALKKYQIKSHYFLSVGRLNPRKNLVSLVKAYYKAKKQLDLPQSLVIAGKKDFNGSKIMQSIRSLEGSDDIVFTGFSADEDLPYLYAGADFFIYPSIFEGVGLPVLEAMKSGVPVIASNTSSLAEVVGEAGITVDPLIEEEIVLAISKMVGNKKLRDANIQKGLVRAKEYVPKIMAQQTLKIYEEVPS